LIPWLVPHFYELINECTYGVVISSPVVLHIYSVGRTGWWLGRRWPGRGPPVGPPAVAWSRRFLCARTPPSPFRRPPWPTGRTLFRTLWGVAFCSGIWPYKGPWPSKWRGGLSRIACGEKNLGKMTKRIILKSSGKRIHFGKHSLNSGKARWDCLWAVKGELTPRPSRTAKVARAGDPSGRGGSDPARAFLDETTPPGPSPSPLWPPRLGGPSWDRLVHMGQITPPPPPWTLSPHGGGVPREILLLDTSKLNSNP